VGNNTKVRRSFFVDTAGTLGISILNTAIGIPISILIARFLGPEGKGVLALLFLVIGQVGLLTSCGFDVALMHHAGRIRKNIESLPYLCMFIGLCCGMAGIAIVIAILFLFFRNLCCNIPILWLALFILTIPLNLTVSLWRSLIKISGRIIEDGLLTLLSTSLNLILTAASLISGFGIVGIVITQGLLALMVFVFFLYKMSSWGFKFNKAESIKEHFRTLFKFGIQSHLGSLLQNINYRIDLYFVAFYQGTTAVGLYSTAVNLAEWLWFLPGVIGTVLMQRIATSTDSHANKIMGPINRLTSLILFIGSGLLLFGGKWVILLLYGPSFSKAIDPLIWLLPGIWALGLWKNCVNDLTMRGYPLSKSVTSGIAAVITVVLNILLIPKFGIIGAAAASSVAYLSAFLCILPQYLTITSFRPSEIIATRVEDVRILLNELGRMVNRLKTSYFPDSVKS